MEGAEESWTTIRQSRIPASPGDGERMRRMMKWGQLNLPWGNLEEEEISPH